MFIQTEVPSAYTLHLRPVKEFSGYEIVKHDYENPSAEIKLKENEKASVTIKSARSDFESFSIYPIEGDFPLKLLNDDQEYELTIYLSDENSIIGGYKGTWKVSASRLANAKKVKFHVLENKGSEDERALFLSGLSAYSAQVPEPEII